MEAIRRWIYGKSLTQNNNSSDTVCVDVSKDAAMEVVEASSSRTASYPQAAEDSDLVGAFMKVGRDTQWTRTHRLRLHFSTFHPQGLVVTADCYFLTSVEVLEAPNHNSQTPGQGIGHLFVIDRRSGKLKRDIQLVEENKYHPGGIDCDGTYIWIPLAEYRPNSSAAMYSVHVETLKVRRHFAVNEHYGTLAFDRPRKILIGTTWGSRKFTEWDLDGNELRSWKNPEQYVDYQDTKYVSYSKMICSGVASLPQNPSAQRDTASATYELGGIALIDTRTQLPLNAVPIQVWSTAGHVVTRNPLHLAVVDGRLTMWAAPDNCDEGQGTEILTYTVDEQKIDS